MAKAGNDTKIIRFEIDNRDAALEEPVIEEILDDFSSFTANLLEKYNIPGDRFRLVIGSGPLDKLLNL
jgi:hypothetical protein